MELGFKDIRLALAAAETLQVPMPIASLVRDHFLSGLAGRRRQRLGGAGTDQRAELRTLTQDGAECQFR